VLSSLLSRSISRNNKNNNNNNNNNNSHNAVFTTVSERKDDDINVVVDKIIPTTKNEPTTKIAFPTTLLCSSDNKSEGNGNGTSTSTSSMSLGGVGVRTYGYGGFINVYAVGVYFDDQVITMMCLNDEVNIKKKNDDLQKEVVTAALLNPTYPRTIRIVLNRALSVETFVGGIVKSVEPRLNTKKGKFWKEQVVTPETFTAFKELFPKVDLKEGDEFRFVIQDDVLLIESYNVYNGSVVAEDGGGVARAESSSSIRSRPITEALCDIYFGKDPISPSLKKDVMEGFQKL